MPLNKLKTHELLKVGEEYGVDLTEAKNKSEMIAILAEEGVTDELIGGLAKVEKADLPAAPKFEGSEELSKENDKTIIKMERDNRSYQTHGFVFTKEHPFVAVPMNTAVEILDTQRGFRLATPTEVKEFYA